MLVGHASAQEATIVTLGDSNTSGFGVGAQEAFPASLEAMLRKREERFPPFLGDFDEKSSRPRTELKRGLIPAQIPLLLSPSEAMAGLASEVCYPKSCNCDCDQAATGVRSGFIELAYTQAIAMLERAEHAESNERYLAGYNL